jgi:hypothetical protein
MNARRPFLILPLLVLAALFAAPDTVSAVGTQLRVAGFDCSAVSQITLADCNALVDLYASTSGAGWTDNTNWLVTTTPCTTWYGVDCSGGRVSDLELSLNNLTGSLPASIGDLTGLEVLWLDNNSLTGSLPADVGDLVLMDWFDVSNNQLSGSLPAGIGNWAAANLIFLDHNQFSGSIPSTFDSSLAQISILALHNNQLSGSIPPELGSAAPLNGLSLHNNQLSGSIPPELGGLTSLAYLQLHNNRLTGSLPSELGDLVNLDRFEVQNNALEGDIPASLTAIAFLTTTDFGYNKLTASDAAVLAWLAANDPDWAATQTVAPANLAAGTTTAASVQLNWTPIPYTGDGGYYEIFHAASIAGPYTLHGTTANKSAATYTAGGLASGSTHYFCVRTYTPAHGSQQNALTSGFAGPVSANTLASGTCPTTATGTLWFNPLTASVTVGSTTSAAIRLDSLANVAGIDVAVSFPASLLQIVDADGGSGGVQVSPGTCPVPDVIAQNSADNILGTLDYAAAKLPASSACSGGTAATITFQCIAPGTASIQFTASEISDPDGFLIAHVTQTANITCTTPPTATNTPLPTATNTPLPTATNTPLPTATNTPLPTATNTPLPTATNTPLPTATNTPLPTATNTPLPTATNTPLPTATNTPLPTATNTPLPTATNTPLPTATNTPLPTATPTRTPSPTPNPGFKLYLPITLRNASPGLLHPKAIGK